MRRQPKRGAASAEDDRGGLRPTLVRLSHAIHDHPERPSRRSGPRLAGRGARRGGSRSPGTAGLPTAFSAEAGRGRWWSRSAPSTTPSPTSAMPAATTSSPHRPSGPASAAPVADELGVTVRVLGTPAEEGGGGKVVMLEHGVFDDVHAAMMVHPWPTDRLEATCLAVSHFDVPSPAGPPTRRRPHGRGSTPAMPWSSPRWPSGCCASSSARRPGPRRGHQRRRGRQHHPGPGDRPVHVPVPDPRGLGRLEPRVSACFEAGALATGLEVAFSPLAPDYSHMESDQDLLALYRANAEALGRSFDLDDAGAPARPSPPTWPTCRWPFPPSIRWWPSRPAGRSTTSPSSPPPASPRRPTPPSRGALAMAWTVIDAAQPGPLRDRLLAG